MYATNVQQVCCDCSACVTLSMHMNTKHQTMIMCLKANGRGEFLRGKYNFAEISKKVL